MPIDKAIIGDYFSGKVKHLFYDKAMERADAFKPHSDGEYPAKLIDERRPNEPLEVKDYRKQIWKPKTKPTFGRIMSSLSKIRRSSDWAIKYSDQEFPRINEKETLEEYCEKKYPYFGSVTNWAFGLLLKRYLTDPNAVCLVMPTLREQPANEYLKPVPLIFCSEHVVDFVEEDYAILENPNGATYRLDNGTPQRGRSFYYVDTEVIERWNQVNVRGDFATEWEWSHGLGESPAFKLGAIITDAEEGRFLHASRIDDILPELDEAIREYSDLQAGKVMHMYPERWEYTQTECPTCKGLSVIHNPHWHEGDDQALANLPCPNGACRGGYVGASPYQKILVKPTNNALEGGGSIPAPPAGYVEKDVEILQLMQESVQRHIYDGLAAINFQFLEQAPLNQSGTAKEVDKDELNNTVHSIAEDLVRIMDTVYWLTAKYRYGQLYPNDIPQIVPKIPVPERFDILSANYLGEELDKAKKANLNPAVLNAMELDYASKKFNADHDVRDRLELILELDPFSNVSEDNKMSMLSNKGITQVNYVISCNIQSFVQRALEEDAGFAEKPWADQMEVMQGYAQELIDSQNEAVNIANEVTSEEDDTPLPNQDPLPVEEDAVV